jgi:putative transposase
MEADDAKRVVGAAVKQSGMDEAERPRLLTNNGSCYISKESKKFIEDEDLGHAQGAPYHLFTSAEISK